MFNICSTLWRLGNASLAPRASIITLRKELDHFHWIIMGILYGRLGFLLNCLLWYTVLSLFLIFIYLFLILQLDFGLQGEKDCSYFVKTGQCKFGSACRFNHPEAVGSAVPSPAPSVYPTVQPTSVPSPQQYPSLGSWQVGGPSISPASFMPGSYGHVLISPSNVPVPGWSPYPVSVVFLDLEFFLII